MKSVSLLIAFQLLGAAFGAIFVDDLGVSHTLSKDSKFVAWSNIAVTLHQLGLTTDQLVGTYGEYAIDGSDFNPDAPEVASAFPADPAPEEIAFLKSTTNLSPSCGNEFCTEFDLETFKTLDADFILVQGYRNSAWAITEILPNITEFMGKPPIFIEVSLGGSTDCSPDVHAECYGKSMIDVINQYFLLATALELDIPDSIDADRQALCQAAAAFSDNAKIAQDKGVRMMAAYLTTATSYFASPTDDMVLRMFEELGAPIMHVGKCTDEEQCPYDYYWEWIPIEKYFDQCAVGESFDQCNETPLYPVDFWLYDHRTTFIVTSDDFQGAFPDRALQQKQYAYWPIGGIIITARHAAEILNIVGPQLAAAERIHPTTQCTVANVNDNEHKRTGLAGGEFACYKAEEHNQAYKSCQEPFIKPAVAGICFSGKNTVEVEGKGPISIDQVMVGDMVQVDADKFDRVYSLSHKSDAPLIEYLKIQTDIMNSPLEISKSHMVSLVSGVVRPAGILKVGDSLLTATGEAAVVTKIGSATRRGAYAPFTMSGSIAVNGIIASNYVSLQETTNLQIGSMDTGISMHLIAHLFQTPHRLMCQFAMDCSNEKHNAEGISEYVVGPMRMAQYFLTQPPLVFTAFFVIVSGFLLIFAALELVVTSPTLMLTLGAGAAALYLVNKKKVKTI